MKKPMRMGACKEIAYESEEGSGTAECLVTQGSSNRGYRTRKGGKRLGVAGEQSELAEYTTGEGW